MQFYCDESVELALYTTRRKASDQILLNTEEQYYNRNYGIQ